MYLESSQDVLNLTAAAAILVVGFLLSWILTDVLRIVRRVEKVSAGIEDGVRRIVNLFILLKDKLENASSYLSVLAIGAKELVKYFVSGHTNRRQK